MIARNSWSLGFDLRFPISKECGPGQPPGPHLLVSVPPAFSPRKGDEVAFRGRIPEGTHSVAAAANQGFAASENRRFGLAGARLWKGRNALGSQKAPKRISENFPRQFTLENRRLPSASAHPAALQNISPMHCEHSAVRVKHVQQRIDGWLCRSCGGMGIFVESAGKTGRKSGRSKVPNSSAGVPPARRNHGGTGVLPVNARLSSHFSRGEFACQLIRCWWCTAAPGLCLMTWSRLISMECATQWPPAGGP